MERIDFDAHDRTRLQWAMVVAFSVLSDEDQRKIIVDSRRETGGYDIQLVINGVECSFKEIMERWEASYSEAVEEDAKKLIEEKMSYLDDLTDEIDHARKEFERVIVGRLRDKAAPSQVFIGQDWDPDERKFEAPYAYTSVEAARESFARGKKCDLEMIQVHSWESPSTKIEDPSNENRYFTQVISHPHSEAKMYLTESPVHPTEAERKSFPSEEE